MSITNGSRNRIDQLLTYERLTFGSHRPLWILSIGLPINSSPPGGAGASTAYRDEQNARQCFLNG